MRIAVVGTGAMGSVYAALLAASGNDVSAVDVDRAHVEAIRAEGLRVDGASGDLVVRIAATTDPAEVGRVHEWPPCRRLAVVCHIRCLPATPVGAQITCRGPRRRAATRIQITDAPVREIGADCYCCGLRFSEPPARLWIGRTCADVHRHFTDLQI